MQHRTNALQTCGRMLSVTEVCIDASDVAALDDAVAQYLNEVPEPLRRMPVLIDADGDAPVGATVQRFADAGIAVIGVTDRVRSTDTPPPGLPVIAAGALGAARGQPKAAPQPVQPERSAVTRIQTAPVRSGQQLYAEGGDLVVLAPVSPGAEVVADGCVHVYAPLRGRAIAGARGDTTARIFCSRQEAELLAVAGTYAVAEQIQDTREQSIQAFLDGDALRIEQLAR